MRPLVASQTSARLSLLFTASIVVRITFQRATTIWALTCTYPYRYTQSVYAYVYGLYVGSYDGYLV